jgi:hypothetical protein
VSIAARAHVQYREEALTCRVIYLGSVIVVSSRYQHPTILKQCGGMASAAPPHLWAGFEGSGFRIVQFRGVECGASRVRTAANDEDAAVGQQSSRVVDAVLAHRAGGREAAGSGIIEFRPSRSAAANQHFAVS